MKKFTFIIVLSLIILGGCTSGNNFETEEVIYSSLSGDVSIPKNPQRIVTDGYCGDLIAIEANVVGCDATYASPAWDMTGIQDVGQSVEAVASLTPDLIITWNQESYSNYSSLAPTVLIPYGSYNEEDLITELGIITGTQEKSQEVLKEFNTEVEELRQLIEEKVDTDNTTFTTMEFYSEDSYVYGNTWARFGYVMYDKLGLKGPKGVEDTLISEDPSGETYLLLTEELINDYVGDIVLVSTEGGKEVLNPIANSETFKNIDAYENDTIYYVDSALFYNNDILSLLEQINVVKDIVENV